MNTKQLSKFLVKAKINTYASSGEGGERIFPDGSKEFEEKEFKYRDRYFGFNPFIGEEIADKIYNQAIKFPKEVNILLKKIKEE